MIPMNEVIMILICAFVIALYLGYVIGEQAKEISILKQEKAALLADQAMLHKKLEAKRFFRGGR